MQAITDLKDLLQVQLQALYSAEMQISKAMPQVIMKVNHSSLQNALTHHSGLTELQLERLAKVMQILGGVEQLSEQPINKGIKGILEEITDLLAEDLSKEVNDAAIIAGIQKIEHYEITCYGTALTYAQQLKSHKAEALLHETLQEEYDADDLLTQLAKSAMNKEALPRLEPEQDTVNDEHVSSDDEYLKKSEKVSISERTINSPGGRAGRSHRGYNSGESRGH
ncbi:DUF892 family protein [Segetibacter sp. 3557_3]|uniref:DUF892 family protein n=1 Tax=Segetibacter sp. 3557_3 TaxID=2547429 RepID=UPI0010587D5F|nr:DUF892 family protein [Segetibacter sp. 3557_3]TDH24168.1 DUF892 family protein [Segetibacter sp. 3557_3]